MMNHHELSNKSKAALVKIYALRVLKNHADFIKRMFNYYAANAQNSKQDFAEHPILQHYAKQGYTISIPINADYLLTNCNGQKRLFAKGIMQNKKLSGFDIIEL